MSIFYNKIVLNKKQGSYNVRNGYLRRRRRSCRRLGGDLRGAPRCALLLNGTDRPRSEEEQNRISLLMGESLTFSFDTPKEVSQLRLWLDPDYSRESVSPNKKMRWFAQKLHTGLDFVPMTVASTIAEAFTVYADGEVIYEREENYHSLVKIPVGKALSTLTVTFRETWGADEIGLFAAELL